MVRIQMSARMYPPKGGIIHMTGIRVAYPLPWVKMPMEFCRKWRLMVQEVECPRISQALKAKRDRVVCILLGELCWVGGIQVDKVVKKVLYCRWPELSKQQKEGKEVASQLLFYQPQAQLLTDQDQLQLWGVKCCGVGYQQDEG